MEETDKIRMAFLTIILIGLIALAIYVGYPMQTGTIEKITLIGEPDIEVLLGDDGGIEYFVITINKKEYTVLNPSEDYDFTAHSKVIIELEKIHFPYHNFLTDHIKSDEWYITGLYKIPDS